MGKKEKNFLKFYFGIIFIFTFPFFIMVLVWVPIQLYDFVTAYTIYPGGEWEYRSDYFDGEAEKLEDIYEKDKKLQEEVCNNKEYLYHKVIYNDEGYIIGIEDIYPAKSTPDESWNYLNGLFDKNLGTLDSVGFCPNGRITFLSNYNFAVVYSYSKDLDYYKYDGDGIDFKIYELDHPWYFLKSDLPKKK